MTLKKAFAIACFSILSTLGFAQNKDVNAPADPKKIKLFFEKAYLQTDRDYYTTGEDVWFSAYLVNGKSTSLTSTSNNLYVELISPKAEVIEQKIIRLDNGLGKGDFKLKDSIPSGWYNIRAYTNWMRNFGDNFVFQKRIFLTNHLKENASYTTRNAGKTPAGLSASKSKNSITFFPEGGSLVAGLNSLVAFKTNDDLGNGVKAVGSIIASSGDTVTTFKSTDAGMGIFAFMPKAGEKYRVEGFYNKEKFSAELPSVLEKGLVLHVTSDSLNIKVAISANEAAFQELNGKALSVVVKHADDHLYSGSLNLTKPVISVSIPIKDFPNGLAVVTVIDHLGRPNAERLIYLNGENRANLVITTNKQSFKPREQVTLKVKATNLLGQPVQTSLSLSAVDGLIPGEGGNIVSYLLLQSEIKGEIKDAEQYFDLKNPSRLKQLDLLLLTQGWRDYVWKKLADSAIKISYMPEPGITIQGKVREKIANKPLANMNITLFGSGFTGDKLFTTKTDQNGSYFLDGLKWYGNQPIKITSKDDKGKKGGWLLIDSAAKPLDINFKNGTEVFGQNVAAEIGKRMDYNRKYKFGDSITLNEVEISANKDKKVVLFDDVLSTFGYPDQVFNITAADYSYKSLEHFLLTRAKGSLPADEGDTVGVEGITFISNGQKVRPRIRVNNREELITERLDYYSLSLDQINQIKIQHLVGSNGKDVFVLSLNLKDNAFGGANLDLLNVNLNGYYQARTFYSPNYNNSANNNKDLRTTIYWSPSIKTNDQGEATVTFFNGDNKSKIEIKANGISNNGLAVSAKAVYQVQ